MIRIDGYAIDLAKTESYKFSSKPTSKSVERGPNISDHIQTDPPQIEFDCIVSNTPVGKVALEDSRQGTTRVSEATYQRLVEIWSNKRLVTVEASRGTFQDMCLSMTVTVSPQDGLGGLHFTAQLQQLTVVELNRTFTVQANLGVKTSTVVVAKSVFWHKRSPPGGVLNGAIEVLEWRKDAAHPRGQLFHSTLNEAAPNQPLSAGAEKNFELDQRAEAAERDRDAKLHPEITKPASKDRMNRAKKVLAAPNASKGPMDPAMLNLKDPSILSR